MVCMVITIVCWLIFVANMLFVMKTENRLIGYLINTLLLSVLIIVVLISGILNALEGKGIIGHLVMLGLDIILLVCNTISITKLIVAKKEEETETKWNNTYE